MQLWNPYALGHELGHVQSSATGGAHNNDYSRYSGTDKCNCNHLDAHKVMCFQSYEYTGTAQAEAWAFFYSAALFNNGTQTDCGMSYWRAMWTGDDPRTDPDDAEVDYTAPVEVDCAWLPRWMEDVGCTRSDRAILQDWLGFYWNLWRTADHNFTIDQISDVYEDVSYSDDAAPLWDDLVDRAIAIHGSGSDKAEEFEDMGELAGVDR